MFILFSFFAFAQIDTTKQKPKPPNLRHKLPKPPKEKVNYGMPIQLFMEYMPRFSGCENIEGNDDMKKNCADEKMLEFIYNNICYPDSARKNGIEGIVVISFTVGKDGAVLNPIIRRDIGDGCGKEALRVIKLLPKFIPSKRVWDNGKEEVVECEFNLPIRFRLE